MGSWPGYSGIGFSLDRYLVCDDGGDCLVEFVMRDAGWTQVITLFNSFIRERDEVTVERNS